MKKRWIAGAMALSVLLFVPGCGNGEVESSAAVQPESQEGEESLEDRESAETEAANEPFYAAILSDAGDRHGSRILEALEQTMEKQGVEYLSYDCGGDQSLQDQQMKEAIQEGASILLIDRVETEDGYGLSVSLPEGESAAVPTVFLDVTERPWESFDGKSGDVKDENRVILAFQEADTGRILGRMAGAWLSEHYETADKNGDGFLSYGLYLNHIEDPATLFCAQYSVEETNRLLLEAGKPELVYFDPDDPDCFQTGTEVLVSDEMELAICSDEEAARNLMEKLEMEIPVFTVGDSQQIIAWLEEGALMGTVVFDQEALSSAVEILTENVRDKESLCKGMEDFPMREEGHYDIPFSSSVSE